MIRTEQETRAIAHLRAAIEDLIPEGNPDRQVIMAVTVAFMFADLARYAGGELVERMNRELGKVGLELVRIH